MKRSTERILTTHVGSLACPKDLLEIMDAKLKAGTRWVVAPETGCVSTSNGARDQKV